MNFTYLEKTSRENLELIKSKNQDYSGNRGDNITRTGLYGIAVRLTDKIERLLNLTDPANGKMPNHESIRDTLRDISNYGLIGLAVEAGEWAKSEYSIKALAVDNNAKVFSSTWHEEYPGDLCICANDASRREECPTHKDGNRVAGVVKK